MIAERAEPEASRQPANVDENRVIASRFGVISIPTLALFVGGVEPTRILGAADSETIIAEVEPHLPQ